MLALDIGQYTSAGLNTENQDSLAARVPTGVELETKGAVFAIADGISSSPVSAIASETAVQSFLDDYYCTADAWSVQSAGEKVLSATNAWLYQQTQQSPYRFDADKGYVCTLSAAIFKQGEAHLFHVGDARIYRLRRDSLEQLTRDHRQWGGEHKSYLSRALGASRQLVVDYQRLPLVCGDLIVLATDGVYEHLPQPQLIELLHTYRDDLKLAAENVVNQALANGSSDNLTVQLVHVRTLPEIGPDVFPQPESLPVPPLLKARDSFDGYLVEREVHGSSRSHVYLARDGDTGHPVMLKIPSIDLSSDPAYLERLLMEEWIARRVHNPHVIRAATGQRPRNFLYTAMEVADGQTLRQWLTDNPAPELETVRSIVEQVANGLQALHRAEILHQDLRPENIMINAAGTVTLIDLGAAHVAGISAPHPAGKSVVLGTALYSAPEYFLGEMGTPRSDLFSLAVLTYHLLSGEFPYGTRIARCTTVAAQHKLNYRSVLSETRAIPSWVDATLKKALQPNPLRRHEALSEFVYELRHPNPEYLNASRAPLMERSPVRFWQSVAGALLLLIFYLLSLLASHS